MDFLFRLREKTRVWIVESMILTFCFLEIGVSCIDYFIEDVDVEDKDLARANFNYRTFAIVSVAFYDREQGWEEYHIAYGNPRCRHKCGP